MADDAVYIMLCYQASDLRAALEAEEARGAEAVAAARAEAAALAAEKEEMVCMFWGWWVFGDCVYGCRVCSRTATTLTLKQTLRKQMAEMRRLLNLGTQEAGGELQALAALPMTLREAETARDAARALVEEGEATVGFGFVGVIWDGRVPSMIDSLAHQSPFLTRLDNQLGRSRPSARSWRRRRRAPMPWRRCLRRCSRRRRRSRRRRPARVSGRRR